MTASRVSRYLEWIAIKRASSGAFLGGNDRGNAASSRVQHTPPPMRGDGSVWCEEEGVGVGYVVPIKAEELSRFGKRRRL